jgi:hypothetical protein
VLPRILLPGARRPLPALSCAGPGARPASRSRTGGAALAHFVRHTFDPAPEVFGDRLDHAEGLLEHIADQIGDRHAEVIGHAADVVGKLLGDPGMEDALLATTFAKSACLSLASVSRRGLVFHGFSSLVFFRVTHGTPCITT